MKHIGNSACNLHTAHICNCLQSYILSYEKAATMARYQLTDNKKYSTYKVSFMRQQNV